MTVESTTSRVSYSGNDVLTEFAYTFRILSEDDIEVSLVTDSTGDITTQTKTTHYTVSGVGEANGGNVTFVTAPATGETIIIKRNLSLLQGTDYLENDTFPAETHENALDELTMIAQQLDSRIDRCLQLPDNGVITTTTLTDTALTAEYVLRISTGGTAIEPAAIETILNDRVADLSALSTIDSTNDLFLIYDNSSSTFKKITGSNVFAAASLTATFGSIDDLGTITPTESDLVILGDADDGNAYGKCTVGAIEAILDHDDLSGYVANEHIDWTSATEDLSTSGTAATGALGVTGNITVTGTVDGRDIATDGTKLDGIEAGATADQTTEEIQDIAGPLVATGGTKTGISVTYQDATGDMDFVVSDLTVAGDTGSTGMTPGDTLTIAGGANITTAMSGDTLTITGAAGGSGDSWGDPVDASIVPDTDSTYNLGSGTEYFANAYIDAITTTGNITVGGTVDGRDIATDGTKLDGIEASADVTDETNVKSSLDGATITAATVATGDKVLIQDVDDSDNLKTVTTQAIADLGSGEANDFVLISSVTASTSSTVSFTGLSSTYRAYMIVLSNIAFSNDGIEFIVRTSTDNGVSYDNGASDYSWAWGWASDTGGTGASGDTADSEISIFAGLGNGTGETVSGILKLYGHADAAYCHVSGEFSLRNATPTDLATTLSGTRLTAADVDAIQFSPSAGTISTGTFHLYGLKAT